jgi:streptogramin lyase
MPTPIRSVTRHSLRRWVLPLLLLSGGVYLAGGSALAPAAAGLAAGTKPVLRVSVVGHGTVTSRPRGISCPGRCRARFARGTRIRLVPHPAVGWKLSRFAGACSSTRACAVTLKRSASLRATFGQKPPQLPSAGRIVATIHISSAPHGLVYASGAIWVGQHESSTVARVDPGTNTVVARVSIPSGQPSRFAAGAEGLWHLPYSGSALYRIDSATNRVVAEAAPPGENCCIPAVGAGSVWVPKADDGIYRVDASSGAVVAHIPIGNFLGSVFGFGSLWGTSGGDVVRLDPATNSIASRIPVDGLSGADPWLGVGAGALWVGFGKKLARIDPSTNTVTALIAIPGTAFFLAAADDAVWVVGQSHIGLYAYSKLWRIDPTANKVTAALTLPKGDPADIAVGAGSLWISLFSEDKLLRLQPAAAG